MVLEPIHCPDCDGIEVIKHGTTAAAIKRAVGAASFERIVTRDICRMSSDKSATWQSTAVESGIPLVCWALVRQQ
jgi:hypothetical protein